MEFKSPKLVLKRRNLTRDEWLYIPIILFVLRVYNTTQLNSVVSKCQNSGGTAVVKEYMFGSSWSVKCVK